MNKREHNSIIDNVYKQATISTEIAEQCFYVLINKDESIYIGCGVRLAELIAANYTNINVQTKGKVENGWCHSVCEITDNETNYTLSEEYWIECGERDKKICMQSSNSIAFRNAVNRAIPKVLIEEILNKIIAFAVNGKNKRNRVNELLNAFAKFGGTEKQVLQLLKIKKKTDIGDSDMKKLIGFKNALQSGEMEWKTLFKTPKKKSFNHLF